MLARSTPVATGLRGLGLRVLAAQGDELILRILPRDRRHIGALGRAQLHVIGAQIGVDDEVGHQVGAGRLHQDVDLLRRARAALRVADDPADRVASGDRAGADELLAGLKRDVGDLTDGGVDLIERAAGVGIDLHGVDEAVADRLHARGGVGLIDAGRRIGRLRGSAGWLRRASSDRAAAADAAARPPARAPADRPSARRARRRHRRSRAASASWRSRRAPLLQSRRTANVEVREAGFPALRKDGFIAQAPVTS